ncbi:MAG TPA: TonB-dependent receptor [Rhizomicrobium sp.]|jgi:outer membrane receptor protein involved in Fe transport
MFREAKLRAIQGAFLLTASATFMLSSVAVAGAQIGENRTQLDIPAQPLASALKAFGVETDSQVLFTKELVQGRTNHAVRGSYSATEALDALLRGTNLRVEQSADHVFLIRGPAVNAADAAQPVQFTQLAQAAPARAAVETVTVTSSKLGGADVQSIPISITALSQEQLTATQTAGGPDLVKQVPNLTFTKTNFAGYSIQIRGIGTQAISVATDPAVAVALNDTPFLRNHFFEQEFFDLSQAEVLRGPQGTLYGRNATAGVVNFITAKPTDQFEAMASAEIGNYQERRFEGMINLPIVDDRLDIRLAGEWTKRNGYSFNETTGQHIDGRDLWSGRLSIAFKPTSNLQTTFVWEHFSEDDDRLRSGKQLCKNQPTPTEVGGVPVPPDPSVNVFGNGGYLGQGCEQVSLYSPDAFQVPNGATLPYYTAIVNLGQFGNGSNPYAGSFQNPNLRVIDSQLEPSYRAKNDILELNTDYNITPTLTFTSQTGFNHDFLYSTEDFNRFVTQPGIFTPNSNGFNGLQEIIDSNGVFCDPQLGCSDRLVAMDLNEEHSWQLSQEFRLASHLPGPFNFSVGGNYMHYETEENYYVFINALSIFAAGSSLDANGNFGQNCTGITGGLGQVVDPNDPRGFVYNCVYMDPNPIGSLNNKGHNYFLNQNPYLLNSYAAFGEAYYDITKDLKLTAGLRFTEDQKHFTDIPSEILLGGAGYAVSDVINQTWDQFTGRAAVNWTPKLAFTDQTLVYGSYAHGYKAGGANPPGALLPSDQNLQPIHPLTFKPEFIDAFELGTKNTLLDGALTLNGDVFYYNYENYQISQIVDRTAINLNFDAHVKGAEIEAAWEPIPGLRFNMSGGWEDATLAKGSQAIDIMDRTAGDPNWLVIKPWPTQASNCIIPTYVVAALIQGGGELGDGAGKCAEAYTHGEDVGLDSNRVPPDYPGWDPSTAPNGGAGIDKKLGGNKLPNAPPLTASFGAQYTIPLSPDWAGTLRTDYYWQDYSWARVYNDNPYDRLRGYTNVNFSLILTNQSGWQVMGYLKNAFNTTAITGAFLNSDDTLLTTNVFLTDPRLLGIRITKNW